MSLAAIRADLESAFEPFSGGPFDVPGIVGEPQPLFSRSAETQPSHSAETVGSDVNGDNLISYLDGLFSSVGAENDLNRQFNAEQAELNRQWTTSMSNTAYQRGMADMKAAGLNPILMFGSGHSAASVPSASAASYQTGGGDTISTIINALSNLATGVSSFLPSISKLLK